MKTIILAGLLALTSFGASAQSQASRWYPLSNSMFVLDSMNNEKVMLSASVDSRTSDVIIRILDVSGSVCKSGIFTEPESFPPYKINGQLVKIVQMCINGNLLIAPRTPEGIAYFHDQINSGGLVTIETNLGPVLTFQGALTSSSRQKLLASRRAM